MNKKILEGFSRGISQLQVRHKKQVEDSIMAILKVGTKAAYHNYRSGRQYLRADQAAEIEKLFLSYGVKDCWGKEE